MKPLFLFTMYVLLLGILINISCKKEYSCENCEVISTGSNKSPISKAGPDQVITLPADSVLLDGSKSSDPDGIISSYLWTKISGPASFTILRPSDSATKIKAFVAGSYRFELTVEDNGGLSAKDTVQVTVQDLAQANRPPIANAGLDQTITLPANSINLNGNSSTDPDHNIVSYEWIKITGPVSFSIVNPSAVQTQLIQLVQGQYHFELKVTDAGGLFAKDTMQVVVHPVLPDTCNSNRPIVNVQLIPFATLSEARSKLATASAGNKILFAGGQTSTGAPSSTVDIYDLATQSWSTAQLSLPRYDVAAIAVGNKVYFAGGKGQSVDTPSSRIDIYDAVTNNWSTAQLSEPRSRISAATVGNKIMFAGGKKLFNCSYCTSDKVDIYDISANTWTVASLSLAREGLTATTAGNKIYFAGGHEFWAGTGVYDRIDIYDNGNNTWTTSVLFERKAHHGSVVIGNYIYWAGGEVWNNFNDYETTCIVEERDLTNGSSAIVHLFQPSFANSNAQPAMNILIRQGSLVFYTGHNQFDIYEPTSGWWSIGKMSRGFDYAGVISVNNIIYIAGGGYYGVTPPSNLVWRLDF